MSGNTLIKKGLVVILLFITFNSIRALYLLGLWLLLQFVGGIGSLGPSAQTGGIAYWAHIGGFVMGVLLAILIRPRPRVVQTNYAPELDDWR